jgi:hypothetical protein
VHAKGVHEDTDTNRECLDDVKDQSISSRMVSSGLLRRVALVRTDVSEEPGASFIRVTKSVN